MQNIPSKLDRIKQKIQKEGVSINQGPEGGWELNGVKAMIADGGYSVHVVTDSVSVWGEHGSGLSGYFRGGDKDLAALLKQMGLDQ